MVEAHIKIIFQTRLEEDVISWENHVNEIIDGIENGTGCKFKVYMINPMPITEMNNSVKELCNFMKSRFNIAPSYYRNTECVAAGYSDMFNSATYYIELK